MDNKYYVFDSKGYLITLEAVPKIFRDAINNHDFSEDGGKNIIRQLICNQYPSNITFPIIFYIEGGKKVSKECCRDQAPIRIPYFQRDKGIV